MKIRTFVLDTLLDILDGRVCRYERHNIVQKLPVLVVYICVIFFSLAGIERPEQNESLLGLCTYIYATRTRVGMTS